MTSVPFLTLNNGVRIPQLGLGVWQVYFRPHTICEPGSVCARPGSALFTKTALWSATVLVLAAITIDWWAPLFY